MELDEELNMKTTNAKTRELIIKESASYLGKPITPALITEIQELLTNVYKYEQVSPEEARVIRESLGLRE